MRFDLFHDSIISLSDRTVQTLLVITELSISFGVNMHLPAQIYNAGLEKHDVDKSGTIKPLNFFLLPRSQYAQLVSGTF